jgi:hypothetical protein
MHRLSAALAILALASCAGRQSGTTPVATDHTPPVKLLGTLTLVDAAFATGIHGREPARIEKTVTLPAADPLLSFWMELSCTGICDQQLTADGELTIFLDWYKEQDGMLLKQASTPLHLKASRWRTWGTKRVTAGKWVAVVRAEDSSWICLREQCHFSIAVQP